MTRRTLALLGASALLFPLLSTAPTPAGASSSGAALTTPTASPRGGQGKVGMKIMAANGGARITEVIPGSGAAAAGLRAGDLVTEVNGLRLRSKSIHTIVRYITGPPGTAVTLTIQRGARQLVVHVQRGRLGQNQAVSNRRVAALVNRVVAAQGGRRAIRRIRGVELDLAAVGSSTRLRVLVGKLGFRYERCSASKASVTGGFNGRHWGTMPATAPRRPLAEALTLRPHAALPNLAALEFGDSAFRLRYLGRTALKVAGKTRLAHRFVFERETYDFDATTLRLLRHQRRGSVVTFDRWTRRSGVQVPLRWHIDGKAYRLASMRFARLDLLRFTSASGSCPAAKPAAAKSTPHNP